jgi:hypothetical protein
MDSEHVPDRVQEIQARLDEVSSLKHETRADLGRADGRGW